MRILWLIIHTTRYPNEALWGEGRFGPRFAYGCCFDYLPRRLKRKGDVRGADEEEWSTMAFTCTLFPTLFRYKIKFKMFTPNGREHV
jgi:hypothetical protein